jgi:hypothetical protein
MDIDGIPSQPSIFERTLSGQQQLVTAQDLLLLLRAVITMGVGLTPVAHLLPMQVLLNLRLGCIDGCG